MGELTFYLDSCLCYEAMEGSDPNRGVYPTFLGEGTSLRDELKDNNYQKCIQVLATRFKETEAAGIKVYAGEPLRRAKNGMEFLHDLREKLPVTSFKILSLQDELRFLSRNFLNPETSSGANGVLYVNGDRLFLIFIKNNKIEFAFMFPLGIQVLRDFQSLGDPPEEEEINRLRNRIASFLDICYVRQEVITWYGIGVFFNMLFHVINSVPQGTPLVEPVPTDMIQKSLKSLTSIYLNDMEKLPGILASLAFSLPYLVILMQHIVDYFAIAEIKPLDIDLPDGVTDER